MAEKVCDEVKTMCATESDAEWEEVHQSPHKFDEYVGDHKHLGISAAKEYSLKGIADDLRQLVKDQPSRHDLLTWISNFASELQQVAEKPELKLPIDLSEILDDPDYELRDGSKKAAEKAFWIAYDADGLSNIFLNLHKDRIIGFLRRELSYFIAMEKLRE